MAQTGDDATIIQAVEMIGNDAVVLGSIPVTGKGSYRISFKPTGSSVQLWILGAYDIVLKPTCYTYPVTTQETYLVDICDENKDRYRFGFNGMEKDNELKGIGNSLDFGARIYDSRTARWLSLDPLSAKYPGLSAYSFAANNPTLYIDVEGKYFVIPINGVGQDRIKLALSDLNEVFGNVKYQHLMQMNTTSGEITFDINKVPANERNGGMQLIYNMCRSEKIYAYEVNTKIDGIDRETGQSNSITLRKWAGDQKNPKAATNLSMTSRGEADKNKYFGVAGRNAETEERYNQYDALPKYKTKDGRQVDGVSVLSPFTENYYGVATEDPGGRSNEYTYLEKKSRGSLAFHELAENYYRTESGLEFEDSHQKAISDEKSLPKEHPAKSGTPGESKIIANPKLTQ